MVESIFYGGSIWDKIVLVGIIFVVLTYVWPYAKTWVQSLLSKVVGVTTASNVVSGIDTTIITVDEYKARVALQTAASLFEKYSDNEAGKVLRGYVTKAVEWSNQNSSKTSV